MEFTHYDLGQQDEGSIIRVTLRGTEANVLLMDSSNFASYRNGRRHRYYGGHAKRSPVDVVVPHSGHWHVAVDLGGGIGEVKSSIQVIAA